MRNLKPSWILIAVLLVIIVLQRECNRHAPCPEPVTQTVIVPGDSVPYVLSIPRPYPVFRDTGSTRWRYRKIDTNAILEDYFARNIYRRILKDDSSAFIVLTDTVTENKLLGAKLEFMNRRATAIHTHTYAAELRRQLFIGLGAGGNPYGVSLSGQVLYVNKKNNAYGLSADPFNKNIQFIILWKL